jgi:hypothetical protein
MACEPTGRVAQHYHATIKESDAKHAPFSVVAPIIINLRRQACKDLLGALKIEPSLSLRTHSRFARSYVMRTTLVYIHQL